MSPVDEPLSRVARCRVLGHSIMGSQVCSAFSPADFRMAVAEDFLLDGSFR